MPGPGSWSISLRRDLLSRATECHHDLAVLAVDDNGSCLAKVIFTSSLSGLVFHGVGQFRHRATCSDSSGMVNVRPANCSRSMPFSSTDSWTCTLARYRPALGGGACGCQVVLAPQPQPHREPLGGRFGGDHLRIEHEVVQGIEDPLVQPLDHAGELLAGFGIDPLAGSGRPLLLHLVGGGRLVLLILVSGDSLADITE